MAQHTTDEELGAGLHVLREAEPLKRAGSLAVSLRADLCVTLDQADAARTERSALPPLDADMLARLEELAQSIARARRISARTRERAALDVGQRLASVGVGLAVHPDTIRDRASAVDDARTALATAEQALAGHDAEVARIRAEVEESAAEAEVQAEAGTQGRLLERGARLRLFMRARQSRALGSVIAAFGLGLILLGLGVTLWAALLPTLGASLWATYYLRPKEIEVDDDDLQARQEASDLLSYVAKSTDEVYAETRLQVHERERAGVVAQRDLAIEKVRVAQRAWEELAGEGIDIAQVDEVVRRFDPQHEDARLLAGHTVGVRATEVVLRQIQERFDAFWHELGLDPPPPEWGEEALRDLMVRVCQPIVLVGPATVRAEELAQIAPAAAVVVIYELDAEGPAFT